MCRELFTCKPVRSQERPRVGGVCRELFTCKPFRSWERSPVSNVCLELLTCKLSGLGTGPGYKRVDGRPGREGGWRKACRGGLVENPRKKSPCQACIKPSSQHTNMAAREPNSMVSIPARGFTWYNNNILFVKCCFHNTFEHIRIYFGWPVQYFLRFACEKCCAGQPK